MEGADIKLNINISRILDRTSGQRRNENAQIFYLKNLMSKEEIRKKANLLKELNFPSIYIIVLNCNEKEIDENFLYDLSQKFADYEKVFLQINSYKIDENGKKVELVLNFFKKTSKNGKFSTIHFENFESLKDREIIKIEDLESVEDFFQILAYRKVSLVDVDLSKIFGIKNVNEIIWPLLKARNEELLQIFLLFSSELSKELLDEVLECESLEILLSFLKIIKPEGVSSDFQDKLLKIKNIKSLLEIIAFKNQSDVLNFFTNNQRFPFSSLIGFDVWNEIREISHDNNSFEFSSEIQKIEIEFYDKLYDAEEKESYLNNIPISTPKALINFHKNIEEGNFDRVKDFVEKFPWIKICADENNVTAMQKALQRENQLIDPKKIKIYAYLKSESFLSLNNDLEKKLSTSEQKNLAKYNMQFTKPTPEYLFNALCNKCNLFSASGLTSYSEIKKNLIKFIDNNDLRPILEFIKDLQVKITFDYKDKSIKNMIPYYGTNVKGLARTETCEVFVGRDENEENRFGCFIHELMHLVLFLLYENKYLPYCNGDTVKMDKWLKIVEHEEAKKNNKTEEIIQNAFLKESSKHVKTYELAVRPPHIIARYINDLEKAQDLSKIHSELFKFFKEEMLPDIMMKNTFNIISLNKELELIERAKNYELQLLPPKQINLINFQGGKLVISSNFPQLTIQKMINEIFEVSSNKLELKVNNIFAALNSLNQKYLKQSFDKCLEDAKVDRIIFLIEDNEKLNIINSIDQGVKVFCIAEESFASKLIKKLKLDSKALYPMTHEWNELKLESQQKILCKDSFFQSKKFAISEVLREHENISSKVFKILGACKKLKIGYGYKKIKKYIRRVFLKKKEIIKDGPQRGPKEYEFEEVSLKNFIDDVKDDQIVIISDQAGSGKTTILHKVQKSMRKNLPNEFIVFVGLKDQINKLPQGVNENFVDFMIKILKFDALEAQVFREKFSKGEVRILFDAFDEISPECKSQTLKIINNFRAQSEDKNQIWITTRTHLEDTLESNFKFLAHKLKILNSDEQIKLLMKFWGNPRDDNLSILEHAQKLITKISKMVSKSPNVIGLPLLVENLGKYYSDRIHENFLDEIETLSISNIYDKIIIKGNWRILGIKFPKKHQDNSEKINSIRCTYFHFAFMHIFGQKLTEDLELYLDKQEWSPEEITRGGVTNYDKDENELKFNHETYAEFLVVDRFFQMLRTVKNPRDCHIELLNKILTDEKLQIARMFLNDMLENYNEKDLVFFNLNNENVKSFLAGITLSTLEESTSYGLFNIVELILKKLKLYDVQAYKKIIEIKCEKTGKTILQKTLPSVRNVKKFCLFMDEVIEFYGPTFFNDFLFSNVEAPPLKRPTTINQRKITYGNIYHHETDHTILHLMSQDKVKPRIFQCFIEKIFNVLEDREKKVLLTYQDSLHESFFQHCVRNYVENFELFEKVFEVFNCNVDENDRRGLLKVKVDKNILHHVVKKDVKIAKFVFDYLKKLLSLDDYKKLLEDVDSENNNILHLAAELSQSKELVEFLLSKINEITQTPIDFLFQKATILGKQDQFVLEKAAINKNGSNIFELIFETIRKFYQNDDDFKDFILGEKSVDSNLLTFVAQFATKEVMQFLFKRILEIYGKNETKKMLKHSQKFQRNLLSLAVFNKSIECNKFLWKFFEKIFDHNEMFNILNEEDRYHSNIFHVAANFTISKKIFEFLWLKIEKIFGDEQKLVNLLNSRNTDYKENVLQSTIRWKNEISFRYIFSRKSWKLYSFKDFLNETDQYGENFLHSLARSSTALMLDFTFKMLRENLNENELKKFLMSKSIAVRRNIFHFSAARNVDYEAVTFLVQTAESILTKSDLKAMLSTRDDQDHVPLEYAVQWNHEKNLAFFVKLYEENFTKRELKNMLDVNVLNQLLTEAFYKKEKTPLVEEFCRKNLVGYVISELPLD